RDEAAEVVLGVAPLPEARLAQQVRGGALPRGGGALPLIPRDRVLGPRRAGAAHPPGRAARVQPRVCGHLSSPSPHGVKVLARRAAERGGPVAPPPGPDRKLLGQRRVDARPLRRVVAVAGVADAAGPGRLAPLRLMGAGPLPE